LLTAQRRDDLLRRVVGRREADEQIGRVVFDLAGAAESYKRARESAIAFAETSKHGSPVELYQRAVPLIQTASVELVMTVSKVGSLELAEDELAETER
jgi:acyl CoA:acetate/3-ketoacid CoA transferase beta subunit